MDFFSRPPKGVIAIVVVENESESRQREKCSDLFI